MGDKCTPVAVEVLTLSLNHTGAITYRRLLARLGRQNPDEVALALAGVASAPGGLCHSTSWRAASGSVVLTYAALPDPLPVDTIDLREPGILSSADLLRPTPHQLHHHHVVAHAVRHLALLASTDPTITASTTWQPQLWAAITRSAAAMPVGPHADIHAPTSGDLDNQPQAAGQAARQQA
jgi:hypothetical protein